MISIKNIKAETMKKILIALLLLGVAVDAYLAASHSWPTFSRIARDSSPLMIILIWLYGIATGNIFFQKEISEEEFNRFPIGRNFGLFLFTGLGLILYGIYFHECIIELPCNNGQISSPMSKNYFVENVYFSGEKSISPNREFYISEQIACDTSDLKTKYWFKKDLSYLSKLLLYVLGIMMTVLLWPRKKHSPKPEN